MEFTEYRFSELLSNIVDNRGRTCPTAEQGIPLIATNCVKNDGLYPTWEKLRYVSKETYDEWFRGHPEPGDLLFVCKGSPGNVCWVPEPVPFCIAQDMVAIRADEQKVYPKYLFAVLRSEDVQQKISNMHVGTLIPHFKKKDFASLFLQIPDDYGHQIKVGDFYYDFSSKIEVNKKENRILEETAQALFKSWFVDFEPVKAKAAALEAGSTAEDAERAAMQAISGKSEAELDSLKTENPDQYESLGSTAALFPSAMAESELGGIPDGWHTEPLDSIAKYQNGLALQRYRPENEDDYLPAVKIAQLRQGFADGEEKASPNIKPECIIDNGDVVFSWSGSLMVDTWCGGKAALNQHLFKVTSERFPKWFYYYYTKHHLNQFQKIAADKAVTMGHIKREHLRQSMCVVPPAELLASAESFLGTMLEKQITNRVESGNLMEMRDALLPKLLSGELNISGTESDPAEAAEA
jgi:type I restriction enzyme S subunit